jgi:hypothetical protein
MREGPQPQLLLTNLPQPGKTMWFNDQEKDDQRPKNHQFDLRDQRWRQGIAKESMENLVEKDRQQGDEDRPEEGAENRTDTVSG